MPQTTQPCSSSHVVVGATSAATIINGVGVDTFTPGTGYDGGNHYVASAQDYQNAFNAFGSANYAGLACRVTVNYNSNIGQGFRRQGDLLWTDTYSSVEQVKAAELNGNVVTGVNSYFCELKGGLGSTTSMTAPPATGSFGARPALPAYSTATISTSPMRDRATTSLTGATRPRQGRLELRRDDLRLQRRPGRRPQPQRIRHGGLCRGEAWLRWGKRSGQLGQPVADRNRRYRRPVPTSQAAAISPRPRSP